MAPTLPLTHPRASPAAGTAGEAHLAAPHTAPPHFMVKVTQEQEKEMRTRCEDTPKGNDPQGFTTTTVCSSKQMVLSVTCQSG